MPSRAERKALKARARRKDFIRRRNINSNIPVYAKQLLAGGAVDAVRSLKLSNIQIPKSTKYAKV